MSLFYTSRQCSRSGSCCRLSASGIFLRFLVVSEAEAIMKTRCCGSRATLRCTCPTRRLCRSRRSPRRHADIHATKLQTNIDMAKAFTPHMSKKTRLGLRRKGIAFAPWTSRPCAANAMPLRRNGKSHMLHRQQYG